MPTPHQMTPISGATITKLRMITPLVAPLSGASDYGFWRGFFNVDTKSAIRFAGCGYFQILAGAVMYWQPSDRIQGTALAGITKTAFACSDDILQIHEALQCVIQGGLRVEAALRLYSATGSIAISLVRIFQSLRTHPAAVLSNSLFQPLRVALDFIRIFWSSKNAAYFCFSCLSLPRTIRGLPFCCGFWGLRHLVCLFHSP